MNKVVFYLLVLTQLCAVRTTVGQAAEPADIPEVIEELSFQWSQPPLRKDNFEALSSEARSSGYDDCPCIDLASQYEEASSSLTSCNLPTNNTGVLVGSLCIPPTFGSSVCDTHDLFVDPRCQQDGITAISIPQYCFDQWCYVDYAKCKRSAKSFYRSSQVDDLYYSYDTCNSTNQNWQEFQTSQTIHGKYLRVAIPTYLPPAHFKLTADGNFARPDGPEYYNDSVPWKGWMIEYLDDLASISTLSGFNYTFRSVHADVAKPSSIYTASVYDVQAGVSDMAASRFWITPERLDMTPFTTQLDSDRLYLWVKQPEVDENNLYKNAQKVARPFSTSLWGLLLCVILISSVLAMFYANEHGTRRKWWRKRHDEEWQLSTPWERFWILLRMYIDSFLQNSTFFFGHTVEYDIYSNMAQKVHMFGFGFLILIAVASYTANLAAFLTLSTVHDYVKSMEDAIDRKIKICALSLIQRGLQEKWPDADFIYLPTGLEYPEKPLLQAYDEGKCEAVVIAHDSVYSIPPLMEGLCSGNLVSTGSLVTDIPVAFPASKDVVGGISFLLTKGSILGVAPKKYKEANFLSPMCSLTLDTGDQQTGELLALTPEDLALPFVVFSIFAVLSLMIYFWSAYTRRKNKLRIDERKREMSERPGEKNSDDISNHQLSIVLEEESEEEDEEEEIVLPRDDELKADESARKYESPDSDVEESRRRSDLFVEEPPNSVDDLRRRSDPLVEQSPDTVFDDEEPTESNVGDHRRRNARLGSLKPLAGLIPGSYRRLSSLMKIASGDSKTRRRSQDSFQRKEAPSPFEQRRASIQELLPTLVDNEASSTLESRLEALKVLHAYQLHIMNDITASEKKKHL